MRTLIILVIVVYLAGVCAALAPTLQQGWTTDTAADLSGKVVAALPDALIWPANLYHQFMDSQSPKQ